MIVALMNLKNFMNYQISNLLISSIKNKSIHTIIINIILHHLGILIQIMPKIAFSSKIKEI